MFLFIDESEDNNHFILAGIKVLDKRFLEDIIRDTRRKFVRNKSLKQFQLNDLNEFHEHILNDKYPNIKRFIFEAITYSNPSKNHIGQTEVYAVYAKKPTNYIRDNEYRRLSLELLKICIAKTEDIHITFDNYGNRKFQESIYSYLRNKLNLSANVHLSH